MNAHHARAVWWAARAAALVVAVVNLDATTTRIFASLQFADTGHTWEGLGRAAIWTFGATAIIYLWVQVDARIAKRTRR